jgi:hypothetical protein
MRARSLAAAERGSLSCKPTFGAAAMSNPSEFPYITHLNILYRPLTKIDVGTRAPERAVILMMATASIVPTGDA